MQFLPSGSDDESSQSVNLVVRDNQRFPDYAQQPQIPFVGADQSVGAVFNFRHLLRKYWLLLSALLILGAAGGFASVVLTSPKFRSRLLLEVENPSGAFKNDSGSESNEIGIQTQVTLLRNGTFLRRGAERVNTDSVPLAPAGRDFFSRLRQRIRPNTQDPIEAYKVGLTIATGTFDARPIVKTRLIELSCESTSPDVAAQFLNAMALEFVEANNRSRMQNAQKTSEWLAGQIDETKARVKEAEERLQEFVQASGNIFAGQDNTLDDTKLAQLKGDLAKAQGERIRLQTRYELTTKYPPEQLGEVLDDGVLRGFQQTIETLKREKASLLTTFTEKHEKVRKVDAQLGALQKSYESEVYSVLKRIKHDYEASLRQEKALTGAYSGQSQRVGSEAGKAAQYNALRREVETQRQMYQTLLVQQSQANMSSSVPVNPIRVVEQAVVPDAPYKPSPVLNISFGTMLGLALTGGLIFLTERADRSIKAPGISRRLFNAPELGVIPNLVVNGNAVTKQLRKAGANGLSVNGHEESALAHLPTHTFVTESFRSTLASILRIQASGRGQKTILVTSPGPAEGKTTVVQNLGIVLAESGRKVLLIDADFRRPHLHRKFGLPNEWGLVDLLTEERAPNEYLLEQLEVPTGILGLSILPNRVTQNNVAKALYSPRLRSILEILTKRYDMVLIDAPPILGIADARIIAPLTDALILVLRCGSTDRDAALAAYQTIQEDGLSLLGTVLTDYDTSLDRNRQYYYDYGNPSRA